MNDIIEISDSEEENVEKDMENYYKLKKDPEGGEREDCHSAAINNNIGPTNFYQTIFEICGSLTSDDVKAFNKILEHSNPNKSAKLETGAVDYSEDLARVRNFTINCNDVKKSEDFDENFQRVRNKFRNMLKFAETDDFKDNKPTYNKPYLIDLPNAPIKLYTELLPNDPRRNYKKVEFVKNEVFDKISKSSKINPDHKSGHKSRKHSSNTSSRSLLKKEEKNKKLSSRDKNDIEREKKLVKKEVRQVFINICTELHPNCSCNYKNCFSVKDLTLINDQINHNIDVSNSIAISLKESSHKSKHHRSKTASKSLSKENEKLSNKNKDTGKKNEQVKLNVSDSISTSNKKIDHKSKRYSLKTTSKTLPKDIISSDKKVVDKKMHTKLMKDDQLKLNVKVPNSTPTKNIDHKSQEHSSKATTIKHLLKEIAQLPDSITNSDKNFNERKKRKHKNKDDIFCRDKVPKKHKQGIKINHTTECIDNIMFEKTESLVTESPTKHTASISILSNLYNKATLTFINTLNDSKNIAIPPDFNALVRKFTDYLVWFFEITKRIKILNCLTQYRDDLKQKFRDTCKRIQCTNIDVKELIKRVFEKIAMANIRCSMRDVISTLKITFDGNNTNELCRKINQLVEKESDSFLSENKNIELNVDGDDSLITVTKYRITSPYLPSETSNLGDLAKGTATTTNSPIIYSSPNIFQPSRKIIKPKSQRRKRDINPVVSQCDITRNIAPIQSTILCSENLQLNQTLSSRSLNQSNFNGSNQQPKHCQMTSKENQRQDPNNLLRQSNIRDPPFVNKSQGTLSVRKDLFKPYLKNMNNRATNKRNVLKLQISQNSKSRTTSIDSGYGYSPVDNLSFNLPCSYCNMIALFECPCKRKVYCSLICQKTDWYATHEKEHN
nr:uncharacterized protein LOC111417307 isoform X1 [Onthophagus taurus]